MRDYFMRTKNKPTGSNGDSSGSAQMQRLSFLQTGMLHRGTTSNVPDIENDNSTASGSIESTQGIEYCDITSEASTSTPVHQPDPNTSTSDTTITPVTPHTSKRRRQDKEFECFLKLQNDKLDTFKSLLAAPSTTTAPPCDELSSFFNSMEEATRKLPTHLQRKVKRSISTLVYDAEEENENENTIILNGIHI